MIVTEGQDLFLFKWENVFESIFKKWVGHAQLKHWLIYCFDVILINKGLGVTGHLNWKW